jgi:hypothetical protein
MNSIFCTYDLETGFVTSCANANPPTDKEYIVVDAFPNNLDDWKVVDGQLVEKTEEEKNPPKSYGYLRHYSYMGYGDQLDAIYKGFLAIKNQVQLPQETLDWMTSIESVKAEYPKD